MLTAFTCATGRPARVVDVTDAKALHDAVWIDLLNPTDEERRLV